MCFIAKIAFLAGLRRLIAVLVVLAYVATTLGFSWSAPVFEPGCPLPLPGSPMRLPFGQQCWTRCCCFTTSQRLSWAEATTSSPPLNLPGGWRPMKIMTSCSRRCTLTLRRESGTLRPVLPTIGSRPATGRRPAGPTKRKAPCRNGLESPKCQESRPCGSSKARSPRRRFLTAWAFDWTVVDTVPTLRWSFPAVTFLPAVPPPRAAGRLVDSATA